MTATSMLLEISANMNVYVQVPWLTVLTVVSVLLVFVGIFMVTAYYALNKRFLSDMPEHFDSL